MLAFPLVVGVFRHPLRPAPAPARPAERSARCRRRAAAPPAPAASGRGHSLRRGLVAAELALAVVLLIGAGLLIRSFAGLQQVAPGFNPANVLTFELTMTGRKYTDAQALIETYR